MPMVVVYIHDATSILAVGMESTWLNKSPLVAIRIRTRRVPIPKCIMALQEKVLRDCTSSCCPKEYDKCRWVVMTMALVTNPSIATTPATSV